MLLTRSRITARNDGRSLPFDESHSSSSTYVDTHTLRAGNSHAGTRVLPLYVHLSRVRSNAALLPRSGSMLDPLYSFATISPFPLSPLASCGRIYRQIYSRQLLRFPFAPPSLRRAREIDGTFDERRDARTAGIAERGNWFERLEMLRRNGSRDLKHLCGGRASSGSKHRPFGDDLPTVRALARQIALPNRAS